MSKALLTSTIGTGVKTLMWLGAGASVFTFGLYFYKFAPGHWFELSADKEVWALLGDYVGGVLNPYLSFLAFIGIAITVVLQARQLDITRNLAELEEVQRLLATAGERIDARLDREHSVTLAGRPANTDTLRGHLAAIGHREIARQRYDAGLPVADELAFTAGFHAEADALALRHLYSEFLLVKAHYALLAWCLLKYTERGGSPVIREAYERGYTLPAAWLQAVGVTLPREVMDAMPVRFVIHGIHVSAEPKDQTAKKAG